MISNDFNFLSDGWLEEALTVMGMKNIYDLIEESIKILDSCESSLRYSFCALGLREVLREFFQRLSPDDDVKKCWWWKGSDGKRCKYCGKLCEVIVTRADRLRYAIVKNIKHESVVHKLHDVSIGIQHEIKTIYDEIEDMSKKMSQFVKNLNSTVHSFGSKSTEIFVQMVNEFISLFERIILIIYEAIKNSSCIIQMRILSEIEVVPKYRGTECGYLCGGSTIREFSIDKHDSCSLQFNAEYEKIFMAMKIGVVRPSLVNRYKLSGVADGSSLEIKEFDYTAIHEEVPIEIIYIKNGPRNGDMH